ncbi:hypothetical protein L873DRAFT_1815210 [Choiromyces venosus 120613-1]|uniref:Uncharacterized protein n=1 Tax=Choiromyces venosus 120613-1 TaxID=1336337 RepID=A0A3N4JJ45_9PEZI|nr:hypothetical protein L873DRAFT_1815210 [Choiromyces venosus 120613-1]
MPQTSSPPPPSKPTPPRLPTPDLPPVQSGMFYSYYVHTHSSSSNTLPHQTTF